MYSKHFADIISGCPIGKQRRGAFLDILSAIQKLPELVADNQQVVISAIKAKIPLSINKGESIYICQEDPWIKNLLEELTKQSEILPAKPKLPPIIVELNKSNGLSELFEAARRITAANRRIRSPEKLITALKKAVDRIPSASFNHEYIIVAMNTLERRKKGTVIW